MSQWNTYTKSMRPLNEKLSGEGIFTKIFNISSMN